MQHFTTYSPNDALTAAILSMLYNDQDLRLNKETPVRVHCERCAALTTERREGRLKVDGRMERGGRRSRGNEEEEVAANPSLCLNSWKWGNELICLQSDGDSPTKREPFGHPHKRMSVHTPTQFRSRNNMMALMLSAHRSQPHAWSTCKLVQTVKSSSAQQWKSVLLFCNHSKPTAHLVCRLRGLRPDTDSEQVSRDGFF